jgi:hypothetical protein
VRGRCDKTVAERYRAEPRDGARRCIIRAKFPAPRAPATFTGPARFLVITVEVKMRNASCLVAALLLTAGCVQDGQYPSTAYNSGYNTGSYYGYTSDYGTAYSPGYVATTYSPSYSTAYSGYVAPPPPRPTRSERYWNSARRDYDRDGIPNRYDRDANGDGIPDRYQGRAMRY